MSIPAWQVSHWNTVRCTAREWNDFAPRIQLISSSINVDPEAGGVRYGQVLWGGSSGGDMVGLAWDWRELRANVIALSDPMTILSNVRLTDDQGDEIDESHRLICLNETIFSLGWQERLGRNPLSSAQLLAA